jgi:hypothetical protein
MANLYYNLSLASGGTGTTSNPYGLEEWLHKVITTHSDILYVKGTGSHLYTAEHAHLTICGEIHPWHTNQENGVDEPWIMTYNQGNPSEHWRQPVISIASGSIIDGGLLFIVQGLEVESNVTFKTTYIETSLVDIYINDNETSSILGCTIFSNGSNDCICINFPDEPTSSSQVIFKDSLLQTTNLTSYSAYELSGNFIITLDHCAIEDSGFNDNTASICTTVVDTSNQWGWSGEWIENRSYNSPYTLWSQGEQSSSVLNLSTILVNVTAPPRVGNSPYVGYSIDLFGNPRIDIGAGYCPVANNTTPPYFSPSPLYTTENNILSSQSIQEQNKFYKPVLKNIIYHSNIDYSKKAVKEIDKYNKISVRKRGPQWIY